MPKGSFFSDPENYRETDKKNNNLRTSSVSNSNRNENYLGASDRKYYPHMQEEPFHNGHDNYRGKPKQDENSGKQSNVYNNNYKTVNGMNVTEDYPRKPTGSFYDPEKFQGQSETDNYSTTSLGLGYNDAQNYKGKNRDDYNYEELNEWDYRNYNNYDGNYEVYQDSATMETNYYVPNDYKGRKKRNEDEDYMRESMYYVNSDSRGNNLTKEDEELLKSFYNNFNSSSNDFRKREEKFNKTRDHSNNRYNTQQNSKGSNISEVRKKFFDLNHEITEEDLTEMVRSLDNIPSINDILHIWWQLREVERHKFAMMQYRLMKYIGHLTNTYDLLEDFAKDLWVAYSKYIATKLEKKENFYNKVFYSFIKREAVTKHALECFLSDCVKSFHQYMLYLNKKCQDRIACDVIEKENMRRGTLAITMGE